MDFPLKLLAIKIEQPLGVFYLTKINASILQKISYSVPLRVDIDDDDDVVSFIGAQRDKKVKKLKEIGRFIDTVECAFPNNIIVAANYDIEGNHIDEEELRWGVEEQGETVTLTIPTAKKLAAIVDGQHRLEGFKYSQNSERSETVELPISVYIDLPTSYQAYLFATINHNQQPVNKSLSYILYGYNMEDEDSNAWVPEKLAVYLSRKLNTDEESPFYRKIKVAPEVDKVLLDKSEQWAVSTATVVDGILGLISKNPKRDRDELSKKNINKGRNRKLVEKFEDESPLRNYYIFNQDIVIYKAVVNFFTVISKLLFTDKDEPENKGANSLMKTIGIQALFDVLKENLIFQKSQISMGNQVELDLTTSYYQNLFKDFEKVNFFDDSFPKSSATGRLKIKNYFLYTLGYKKEINAKGNRLIKEEDILDFNRLNNKK